MSKVKTYIQDVDDLFNLPHKEEYVSLVLDEVNYEWSVKYFDSLDQAIDHMLIKELNTDKVTRPPEQFDIIRVFERHGHLYQNWLFESCDEEKTGEFNLLFPRDKYTPEKPHSVVELAQYFRDGHDITVLWGSRSPVTFQILTVSAAKEKFQIIFELNGREIDPSE